MFPNMSVRLRSVHRLISVVAVSLLAGCQSIGPVSLARDRLDYGGAIAESWREQTLLNIVKLRYFDAPVFMEVSSVISSYTLQSEVSLTSRLFPRAPNSEFREFGATGNYTDRPTISYLPVTGKQYVEKLLRPISPQAIFAMIQAGHQAEYILPLTVRSINDAFNFSGSPARSRSEDPAFSRIVELIGRIQQAGALGVKVERRGREEETIIYFRDRVGPEIEQDIRSLRSALGVGQGASEIRLDSDSSHRKGNEIILLTRSMWQILAEISSGVEVPEEDRDRATMPQRDAEPRSVPIARIRSSRARPADAYIAVQYRSHWFWIDDRDLASKRAFTFLMVFSAIAETGAAPQPPIITLPAN